MSNQDTLSVREGISEKSDSIWTHNVRRFRKHTLGKIGLTILLLLYLSALFADFLSPYTMRWGDNRKPYHSPSTINLFYNGPNGREFRPFAYEYRIANVALRTYDVVPEHTVRAISFENRVNVNEMRVVAIEPTDSARRTTIMNGVVRHYRFATDSEDFFKVQEALARLEADPNPDARIMLELSPSVSSSGVENPRSMVLAKGNKNFLSFFNQGVRYQFMGWRWATTNIHFFGSRTGGYFPLGTDSTGRDLASRLLHGARVSLTVGLVGAAITMIIGLLIGGIAGYFGGFIDNLLMRFSEVLISIPSLYLLFALRSALPVDLDSGRVYIIIILILSMIGWTGVARVIRGQVLSIKNEDFVLSARTMGLGHLKIIVRHILPSTLSYAIINTTLLIPGYILGESALSLLGLGITEPQSSWGLMLAVGRNFRVVNDFPFVLVPGFFIFLAILAWNFFGDGIRDAFDPKSKH